MHVLIIEDRKDLALMLKKVLEEREHSAVVAFDGPNGLMHAETGDFDAIVLDLMLPGISGQDIARKLRSAQNRVPILVLTARDTVGDTVTTLDLGVDDYLTKTFSVAEFMARLRAVARRGPAQHGVRLEVSDIILDTASAEVTQSGRPVSLTRTEFLLLDYLMRRAGHVLSRSSLIERVWGLEGCIEANTLEAFIRNLRMKLDDRDDHHLIQTVRGVGYRMRNERSTK